MFVSGKALHGVSYHNLATHPQLNYTNYCTFKRKKKSVSLSKYKTV